MPNSGAIVLVGPMGVGKTTIGKKLAKRLALDFIDTDQVVARQHGPIPQIFEEQGEPHFRALEEEAVLAAIASPAVVATGGGAVLSERTRAAFVQASVVYLATDGKHMASRLVGGNRPLLKDGVADWRRIYESRRHLYEQVADLTVDTSRVTLKSIIEKIVSGLKLDV
jgi:shikimate kinase